MRWCGLQWACCGVDAWGRVGEVERSGDGAGGVQAGRQGNHGRGQPRLVSVTCLCELGFGRGGGGGGGQRRGGGGKGYLEVKGRLPSRPISGGVVMPHPPPTSMPLPPPSMPLPVLLLMLGTGCGGPAFTHTHTQPFTHVSPCCCPLQGDGMLQRGDHLECLSVVSIAPTVGCEWWGGPGPAASTPLAG